jgi:hypothetical protein
MARSLARCEISACPTFNICEERRIVQRQLRLVFYLLVSLAIVFHLAFYLLGFHTIICLFLIYLCRHGFHFDDTSLPVDFVDDAEAYPTAPGSRSWDKTYASTISDGSKSSIGSAIEIFRHMVQSISWRTPPPQAQTR